MRNKRILQRCPRQQLTPSPQAEQVTICTVKCMAEKVLSAGAISSREDVEFLREQGKVSYSPYTATLYLQPQAEAPSATDHKNVSA